MKTLAVIPARYASTRFPGKPLALIHGKPMIQWVYERTASCTSINEVVVATDDERIFDAVQAFGGQAVMTSTEHESGTDRICEAITLIDSDADLVINVQGDEPGIDIQALESLIALFTHSVDIATLVTPFRSEESFQDANRVKAILAENGRALYFSRSPIPYDRNTESNLDNCYQHVGVYAYRTAVLKEISSLNPSVLERKESLEQLRWLENGYGIYAAVIQSAPIGVDTPDDLNRISDLLK